MDKLPKDIDSRISALEVEIEKVDVEERKKLEDRLINLQLEKDELEQLKIEDEQIAK